MLQKRMRFGPILLLILLDALSVAAGASGSEFKLTFDRPASKWTEALPLGNGRIGAMVFGGTEDERLQINESTFWGGGPHDYTNPEAYTKLDEIRQLIFAGKVDEADKLSESLMGQPMKSACCLPCRNNGRAGA
ncbi:MAG: glycoside hydrolase N-terminal domain-containing protein [Candidatus Acidiferrales bacterium]